MLYQQLQSQTMNAFGPGLKTILRLVTILVTLFAASSICLAQRQALSKIEVVGLKRVTQEQVIAASELKIGQMVDGGVLDAAAERLMQSGMFKKLTYRVRGRAGQVTVVFEVEEANRSLPVVFENFFWFSDEELESAIRNEIPFFNGTTPEAGDTSEKIAAALQRLLNEKKIPGRVEVMPYNDLARGRQEILFTVRGVKTPVCSLHFPGAEAVAEAELIKAAQAILQTDYSRKDIGGFANYTLFPLYRRLGRLRAQFQQPTAALDTTTANCNGGVAVTVPVDEGLVYSWIEANWQGNQAVPAAELSTALGMKAGETADGSKIDLGLKEVRKAFGRKGYIAVRVRDEAEFNDSAKTVTYRFTIQEGPQYHMGSVTINGLAPELAGELKESWQLAAGAIFDGSYVDDFRLNALPKFIGTQMQRSRLIRSNAEIEMKPDALKQTVDIVITFK
jgi:outer membrane protein assembly factor BamA